MPVKKSFYAYLLSGIGILFSLTIVFSCNKNDITDTNSNHKLTFSNDTVLFDTVFTSVGSSICALMVYNKNPLKLKISSIRLARGANSPFRLNIDGSPALSLNDVEIAGKDSMYIFVKVTINPNNTNDPLIQSDSILFETNGNLQCVRLVAWGQDAHFYNDVTLKKNTVLTNDKPHVIYGNLTIDSLYTLTIQPGARIYFHHNSSLYVHRNATLKVNGTLDQPVTFQGDRLEDFYNDIPSQWGEIWMQAGSTDNEISYAIIKNGTIGLQVDSATNSSTPTLRLSNTTINNMGEAGLLAEDAWVKAANCVIGNCGVSAVYLNKGGNYDFRHCTIGNFWIYNVRNTPSLVLNNYSINNNGDPIPYNLTNAYFGNCVIYGNEFEEIMLDKKDIALFNYKFENCLFRTQLNISDPVYYSNCIKNKDPLFVDYTTFNLQPDTLSPLIKAGSYDVLNGSWIDLSRDIKGNSRISEFPPDLGAYQRIER